MQCIAAHDGHQCQHALDHSGTHYALVVDDQRTGKRHSVKWPDSATTHIALGDGDHIPAQQAVDAARAFRAYTLEVQKVALALGVSFGQAEQLVQAEKAKYLAHQQDGPTS